MRKTEFGNTYTVPRRGAACRHLTRSNQMVQFNEETAEEFTLDWANDLPDPFLVLVETYFYGTPPENVEYLASLLQMAYQNAGSAVVDGRELLQKQKVQKSGVEKIVGKVAEIDLASDTKDGAKSAADKGV